MATFGQLYRASFKGARFLAQGGVRTSGGRKLIDHTYPGSERRFIEDLGKLQRDFTITGIVQGPSYFDKRDALIRQLESGGIGTLSHPFFGSIQVIAKPYTLTEDLTSVGYGTFEMTFSVSTENIIPVDSGKFKISKFAGDVLSSVVEFITDNWLVSFAANYVPAANLINEVINTFDTASRNLAVAQDKIAAFQKTIVDARSSVNNLIRSAASLSLTIDNLFKNADDIATNSLSSFDLFKSFFGFSEGNTTRTSTTKIREEEIQNFQTINTSMNVNALAQAYLNANLIEYQSSDELVQVAKDLEEQFSSLIDGLDNPLASNLFTLRNEFNRFVDEEIVSLDKITTISIKAVPLTVLTYRYYGSTDNYETLIDLNDVINPSEVEGDFKILTQ